MTISTIRPSGTLVNTGSVTGSSAHAALSDDSDGTYVTLDAVGEQTQVELGTFSLPAGAVVKSVRSRLRMQSTSSWVRFWLRSHWPNKHTFLDDFTVNATPVLISVEGQWDVPTQELTQADIDAAQTWIQLYARASGSSNAVIAESYVDVMYVEKPVVTIDPITDPWTTSSIVTGTYSAVLDPDGGPQTRQRVLAYHEDQYTAPGFEPGVTEPFATTGTSVITATSFQLRPRPSGTYRVYVRVAQTVNGKDHWSDWAYAEFTVAVPAPEIDQITFNTFGLGGYNAVKVTRDTSGQNWHLMEIERSDDGGDWVPVRGATLVYCFDNQTAFEINDHEAPNGVPVRYRARATRLSGGVPFTGDWKASTLKSSWANRDARIVAPGAPSLNAFVKFAANISQQYGIQQGVFYVPGAAAPVVVSSVRQRPSGTLTIRTRSAAEAEVVKALLDEPVWYVTAPPDWDWDTGYIAPGVATRGRAAKATQQGAGTWTVQFLPAQRPPDLEAGEL